MIAGTDTIGEAGRVIGITRTDGAMAAAATPVVTAVADFTVGRHSAVMADSMVAVVKSTVEVVMAADSTEVADN
jgi:hypothetical protein